MYVVLVFLLISVMVAYVAFPAYQDNLYSHQGMNHTLVLVFVVADCECSWSCVIETGTYCTVTVASGP